MDDHLEFDYIICGGGTSGCAVAGRLADLEWARVLVIESGPLSSDLENASMPGGWTDVMETDLDWNYRDESSQLGTKAGVKLTRGKLLGGSSVINGTACVRGSRLDFDDWQLQGWDGDSMFRYMAKAENFHSKDWFEAATDYHGHDGPIHTEPHDVAPISKSLLQSFIASGFPYDHDLFTRGDAAHGVGYSIRTHWQGRRSTAADYLIGRTQRLTIWTGCTIDKVEFVEESVPAKNAAFVPARRLSSVQGRMALPPSCCDQAAGQRLTFKHLVSAAYCIFQIVFMFYETSTAEMTVDASLNHSPKSREDARSFWRASRSGVLASIPFGLCAFARLDEQLDRHPMWTTAPREPGRDPMNLSLQQPHTEYFTTECLTGLKDHTILKDNSKHIFGVVPLLFAPRSRGMVTLRSTDALEPPRIEHNYLSHELDILVLAEACRLANDVVTKHLPVKELVTGSYPEASNHHTFTSHEQWQDFVKANATTCFHPAGTCKMGSLQDPLAVLDNELLVRGTSNLRVADCSVMPKLNGGHTQMPAYAIGEKAADLIKASSNIYRLA